MILKTRTTAAAFCVVLCLLSQQALSDTVSEVQSLTQSLTETTEADANLTAELEKLLPVINRLLGSKAILTEANARIAKGRFDATIRDEVDALKVTISEYQAEFPMERVLSLAQLLDAQMQATDQPYPEIVK